MCIFWQNIRRNNLNSFTATKLLSMEKTPTDIYVRNYANCLYLMKTTSESKRITASKRTIGDWLLLSMFRVSSVDFTKVWVGSYRYCHFIFCKNLHVTHQVITKLRGSVIVENNRHQPVRLISGILASPPAIACTECPKEKREATPIPWSVLWSCKKT